MTPTVPVPTPAAFDLPFARASHWLQEARALWRAHPFFFFVLAFGIVAIRWLLDSVLTDPVILLSYLTDAWIFAWLALGVSRARSGTAALIARTGWQGLKGRFLPVLKTVLWGVPAVVTSSLIFFLVPEGVQALVVVQGNVLLATAILFVALLAGGFISMLLALLPVLAAIQMARDSHATVMSSGLWAYRGLRAGLRPLSVLFVTLLSGVLVSVTALTWGLGHLPLPILDGWFGDLVSPGPVTFFIAMNVFLVVLPSVATDLLRSADVDLSDEIFSDAEKSVHGDAFWVRLLDLAGRGLRAVSLLSVLFLVVYAAFSGEDQAFQWAAWAIVTFIWGGSFRKSARAWREKLSWSLRYRFLITPMVLLVVALVLAVGLDALDDTLAADD